MEKEQAQTHFSASGVIRFCVGNSFRYVHESVLRQHGILANPPRKLTNKDFEHENIGVFELFVEFLYTGDYNPSSQKKSEGNNILFEALRKAQPRRDDEPEKMADYALASASSYMQTEDKLIALADQGDIQIRNYRHTLRAIMNETDPSGSCICGSEEVAESAENVHQPGAECLFHAHLYELGCRLTVPALQEVALSKMRKALRRVAIDKKKGLEQLLALLYHIYDVPPGNMECSYRLRELVATYLAGRIELLYVEQEFFWLLSKLPLLARDVLKPFAQIGFEELCAERLTPSVQVMIHDV
ncbi:hypothetical protein AAL_07244 [Moelleriella libera RCEF 2490]|uniref:BTB/POZ fold protein n=1 Tax=Moelleriella libera RCEF 2490 TaxID=1081109 RepID=A0A167XWI0_9HYPO|nr:hypothetical protein AAL_07244 [Moelleriella libera RCEF 2490]